MNSCAASCCTCFPQASCVSATSASWPTGDALYSYHCAFTSSVLQHSSRRRIKMLLPRTIFGVAPSVVDRWWSSRDSPLQKCNFVLRHWSPLQHDTALPSSNSSRVSARFVPLRLSAGQIPSAHLFNRALCALSSGQSTYYSIL